MITMLKTLVDYDSARMILIRGGCSPESAEKILMEVYGDEEYRVLKVLFNFAHARPFEADGEDVFIWPHDQMEVIPSASA